MPIQKYEQELAQCVRGCGSLLDVGCGADSPIQSFSHTLHAVGVDSFVPSLEKSRSRGIHREYVQADLLAIDKAFAEKSFDCVLASDVIEHFDKQEGLALLQKMERIARRRVIIFTPNGFLPQEPYDGNPWQLHRSGWTVEEMQALGYRVLGMRGWKALRGEYAAIRFRPKAVWLQLSHLSQLFVRNRPVHAFQILCIKDKIEPGASP